MNSITFSFILTTIAGLSTLVGLIPIYIKGINRDRLISISLSLSSGIMLSISINSLLIESYNLTKNIPLIIICIILGIIVSKVINNLLRILDNKLYKIGLINTIALVLHNIPEGILTFSTTTININLGIYLAISIILHNIPEGISISIPIYYSTNSKKKAFIYVLISGFSEVLGAIITYIFLYNFINNTFIGIILSLTTGIMIYISLVELLPTSLSYNHKKVSYIFFIIGYIFMMLFK